MRDVKQLLVLRKDLNMRKGKMAAQAAHGASLFLYDLIDRGLFGLMDEPTRLWLRSGTAKICVGVESEKELLAVYEAAKDAKLRVNVVCDSGHTEVEPGTLTCVAIGPNYVEEIDRITGHLKLL
jgi:PTH2 family peptidyl-tRNA hydrolase